MRKKIEAIMLCAGKQSFVKFIELKKDDVWTVKELVELADFTGTHLSFTDANTKLEMLQIKREDLIDD